MSMWEVHELASREMKEKEKNLEAPEAFYISIWDKDKDAWMFFLKKLNKWNRELYFTWERKQSAQLFLMNHGEVWEHKLRTNSNSLHKDCLESQGEHPSHAHTQKTEEDYRIAKGERRNTSG